MREHNANALRQRRFKHGLSNTKEYKAYLQRLRYEQQQNIDSGWNFEYERLLRLAQPVCVVCGRTEDSNIERYGKRLEVDHVYPLSRGYGLEPGNAVILCTFCNDSKGGKLLHQLDDVMSSRIIAAAESFRHICEAK